MLGLTALLLFSATPVMAVDLIAPQGFIPYQVECIPGEGGVTPGLNFYLKWLSVRDADLYYVYYKRAGSNRDYDLRDETDKTQYKLTVDPKDNYYAAVSAVYISRDGSS